MFTTADHLRARRIRSDTYDDALQAHQQVPPPLPPVAPRDPLHFPVQLRQDDIEAFGSWDGRLELTQHGETVTRQVARAPLTGLALAPDRSAIVVQGEHWHGDLWPLPQGEPLRLVDDQLLASCFSADGSVVALVTRGLWLAVHDRSGELLWRTTLDWEERGELPERLVFVQDDRWLSLEGDQGTHHAWRLGEGAPIVREDGTMSPVRKRPRRPKAPSAIGGVGGCMLMAGVLELTFGWSVAAIGWAVIGGVLSEMVGAGPSGLMLGLLGVMLLPLAIVEMVVGLIVMVEPRAARSWVRYLPWAQASLLVLGGVVSFLLAIAMFLLLRGPGVRLWLMGEDEDVVDDAGAGGA